MCYNTSMTTARFHYNKCVQSGRSLGILKNHIFTERKLFVSPNQFFLLLHSKFLFQSWVSQSGSDGYMDVSKLISNMCNMSFMCERCMMSHLFTRGDRKKKKKKTFSQKSRCFIHTHTTEEPRIILFRNLDRNSQIFIQNIK